ncbi:MAG TPA: alpha/beta fold hydrolase [Thermoanaerobaculia bacterium]|jgi:pimeloyl-ACP methyl ester carboxylesterase|nr:alpha/beta fold hydrolase [Thermoanaerobaculia bacterium]
MELTWKDRPARIREMGSGPAVVLAHGYPLDGAMWSGVARVLAERFRVLKPDFPGSGETEAPAEPSMDDYGDFLAAVLEALPAPRGLAGFSMGGYAALSVMRRRPELVAALALVDSRATPDDEAGRAKRDEAAQAARSGGAAAIADDMVPRLLSVDSQKQRDLVERVRRIILRQKVETIVAEIGAMRDRPDSRLVLPSISVPTLAVVGDQDALTPPPDSEVIAASVPGARLVTITGAAHLTPMERPGAVAAALGGFFGETLSSP